MSVRDKGSPSDTRRCHSAAEHAYAYILRIGVCVFAVFVSIVVIPDKLLSPALSPSFTHEAIKANLPSLRALVRSRDTPCHARTFHPSPVSFLRVDTRFYQRPDQRPSPPYKLITVATTIRRGTRGNPLPPLLSPSLKRESSYNLACNRRLMMSIAVKCNVYFFGIYYVYLYSWNFTCSP